MSYRVNEVFFSIQGEGIRAGTANVFVRFSGCNLTCNREEHGFDCDTEFTSGRVFDSVMALFDEAWACEMRALQLLPPDLCYTDPYKLFFDKTHHSVIFTGGEPGLQLDQPLVAKFKEHGWHVAVETNGTRELPDGIDWTCVSPKSAEHTLAHHRHVDELKYVRNVGQGIPKPRLHADHYLISPAFEANGTVSRDSLAWCIDLVKRNPPWRLSVQQHKSMWHVR